MACGLLYTHDVIGRRLSLQLALVMLLVALVPLAGAGFLILGLLGRSLSDEVRAHHDQLAQTSGAMVRNYIDGSLVKLRNIGAMIKADEEPREQARKLNRLLQPPDLFLEIGYWTGADVPQVRAQVQQEDYGKQQAEANTGVQNSSSPIAPSSRSGNEGPQQKAGLRGTGQFLNRNQPLPESQQAYPRSYNKAVGSWVYTPSDKKSPLFSEPAKGNVFVNDTLELVGDFPALPLSVPSPGGAVLTASLDFRPISQILSDFAAMGRTVVVLTDKDSKILAASRDPFELTDYVEHTHPVGRGGWQIVVREPSDLALTPLKQARNQALIWFGLSSVMAVGLAFLFAGRVIRPVRSLARTADALGRGEFAARTGIARDDEIGQLAAAFDRMAAAVQQIDQVKGEFVAHVSHELRTPLTSAKVTLANVQEGIGGTESLGRVQEDLDRLIRMVNELLDVARLDAGISLAKQRTDLGALVRSTVETLRPIAKVPLTVAGTGETLELDAARVQQIVLNLVDNALKYARSRVDVEVRGREVRVSDDGPGVPAEHRERIFEKFSKVETGPKPPGAGLGLSIARKLAQLHGGTLVCEGNTFVLRF
jgi:signal transduction histidine kinase